MGGFGNADLLMGSPASLPPACSSLPKYPTPATSSSHQDMASTASFCYLSLLILSVNLMHTCTQSRMPMHTLTHPCIHTAYPAWCSPSSLPAGAF